MPPPFLAAFNPDLGPLIKIINQHITDPMLREIAAADYGGGFDENLAPLRTCPRATCGGSAAWRSSGAR
jgi:hypothetical protein